ncbi:GNAT family N-acetyltransferase [Youngiibacter multivorans]|nr:GNAT family N-acetyltransferase [Youngiibacter multivorans]
MDERLFRYWLEERMELWPGEGRHDEHTEEMRQILTGKPVDGGTESGLLMCMSDDSLAGFLEYSIKDGIPGSQVMSAHIEGIHTRERYRRNGIAKALVNRLREIAEKKGIKRLTSDIQPGNEASLLFHSAIGFIVTVSDNEAVYLEKIIG